LARWPKYQRTDDTARQVLLATGYGITRNELANWLRMDVKTLRNNYRHELETGATEANIRVAQSLFKMATSGENVAAAIWWTKARMGWKDTSRVENTGADGQPLVVDFRWASDTPAPLTVDAVVDTGLNSVDTDADTPAIEWSEAEPKGHAD